MDERIRRQWAAAESRAYGWGGVRAVSSAIGNSGPRPRARTEVFKNALEQWFSVPRATNKLIRHHIRAGSATDRFLKRTEVVDGRTVFKAAHANEVDGSWERAADAHMQRAWDALQAERAMAQGPLV